MKRKSIKERIEYQFGNWMSRGTASKLVLLFATTGIIVTILGLVLWRMTAKDGATPGQSIWSVLMHTLDPGTITGDKGSTGFLLIMLLATFAGMFYLAVLIGFINDSIQNSMEDLAMGREAVIEDGQTGASAARKHDRENHDSYMQADRAVPGIYRIVQLP